MPVTISEDIFFIDDAADGGLQMQLRQSISAAILAGRVQIGDRLPSSRKLAQHLKISRITVTLAYQELVADGYLASRDRSGYFVADSAPVAQMPRATAAKPTNVINWQNHLARSFTGGQRLEKPANWRDFPYPFIYGQADATLFNHSAWRSCAHRALGKRDFDALANDHAEAERLRQRVEELNRMQKMDAEIAEQLNAEGFVTAQGQPFDNQLIWMVRKKWRK